MTTFTHVENGTIKHTDTIKTFHMTTAVKTIKPFLVTNIGLFYNLCSCFEFSAMRTAICLSISWEKAEENLC